MHNDPGTWNGAKEVLNIAHILHIRIFLYFCSLFNDAVIHFGYVASNDEAIMMNYVKSSSHGLSWSTFPAVVWRDCGKSRKPSVMIVDVLSEIRIGRFLNRSEKHHFWHSLVLPSLDKLWKWCKVFKNKLLKRLFELKKEEATGGWGRAIAQASYRGAPGPIPSQTTWALWWTKSQYGMFSPSTSVSHANSYFHQMFHNHLLYWDRTMGKLVAAYQLGLSLTPPPRNYTGGWRQLHNNELHKLKL